MSGEAFEIPQWRGGAHEALDLRKCKNLRAFHELGRLLPACSKNDRILHWSVTLIRRLS